MKFAGKTRWVFTVRPFQNAVSVFGIWKHIHSSWSPRVKGNLDWVFKSGKWESAHRIGCWVAQLQWTVLWLGTGATRQKLELACIAVLVRKYLPTLLFQQCRSVFVTLRWCKRSCFPNRGKYEIMRNNLLGCASKCLSGEDNSTAHFFSSTSHKTIFTRVFQVPEQTNPSGLTCDFCVRALRVHSTPALLNSLPSDLHAHHLHPGHRILFWLSHAPSQPHLSTVSGQGWTQHHGERFSWVHWFPKVSRTLGIHGTAPIRASPVVHAAPHRSHGTAPLLLHPSEHLGLATAQNEEQG